MSDQNQPPKTTRSGFIALAGRPNVGKSTLVNHMVGEKVTIVSNKPQTTRRALRAVVTEGDSQLVLVDLPGVQKPLDRLTSRMQKRVEAELADCDGVLLVLNGKEGVGPGDRFIARALSTAKVPVTVALNKVDKLDRPRTVLALEQAFKLDLDTDIFPVSASTGKGVDQLKEHLFNQLPQGPFYYEVGARSDLSESHWIAEVVREKVLHRTRQELPHAVEAEVVDIEYPSDGLMVMSVNLIVETKSQRAILVGHNGQMIKEIGTAARQELEPQLGQRLYINLNVKVERDWRGSDSRLDGLGIE